MSKRLLDSADQLNSSSASSVDASTKRKIIKTHPFLMKSASQLASSVPSSFVWVSSANATCLHGTNLRPTCSVKIAGFDLDGTLINTNIRTRDKKAWGWWRNVVPIKLAQLHQDGYSIVIFSNQNITHLNVWKEKMQLIALGIPRVPFRIFAATQKDGYRKPMPGMWHELERIYAASNVTIDKNASFYIGDAAGRPSGPSGKDHACTDRQWAINVGLKFMTPEEYFLGLPASPYHMVGFHVSSLLDLPLYTPTSTPLIGGTPCRSLSIPGTSKSRQSPSEIIIFVGPPCAGKTRFFRTHIEALGRDYTLLECKNSRTSCLNKAKEVLEGGGSCVFDDTHPSGFARRYAVSLAKSTGMPIRCFLFTASIELAWHNNLYRAYNLPSMLQPKCRALPKEEFKAFREQYRQPDLSEGFTEIRSINWVWDGTDDERKYWEMWTLPMK